MRELVILMLITAALAWCADHVTMGPMNHAQRHRLVFCTLLIIILLAGFAGLRTQCNDTEAYRHAYELITEGSWKMTDKSVGANPLFNWINYQLKICGVSTQFKQAAAVGIAVITVTFALKRKWGFFIAGILIASLIHPYSLMYLLVPFMEFRPWTKRTYWMLAFSLAAGFLLRPLLGMVVNITTLLGEEYTISEFTGEGVNIFRVLVCNVPLVLSYIYRKKLFADSSETENLMVNLTMLNGAIMFVGLFGTANYFARLANYFLIFQSLSLPWMLKKIGGRDGRILKILMVAGYLVYFCYENAINRPFDQDFARLSLSEYLNLSGR